MTAAEYGGALVKIVRSGDVGMSRSAFAERFTRLVGEPPIQYLTRWRMQMAARLLTDGSAKVGAIALEVGYDSEGGVRPGGALRRVVKEARGRAAGGRARGGGRVGCRGGGRAGPADQRRASSL